MLKGKVESKLLRCSILVSLQEIDKALLANYIEHTPATGVWMQNTYPFNVELKCGIRVDTPLLRQFVDNAEQYYKNNRVRSWC